MNHIYRLVWNSVSSSFVAVSEFAKARGKKTSAVRAARAESAPAGATSRCSRVAMGFMALEPRVMFDGAALATVDAHITDSALHDVTAKSHTIDTPPPAVNTNTADTRTEIVFIESNVADYQTLLNGVNPGAEVHVLDAGQDGLAQMAQILGGRSGVDAIHIISHGSEGSVGLGTLNLSAQNIGDHAADLTVIGGALDANADILLYGCNVAAGSDGAALVDALAQATQADIAASTDLTGAAVLGGDWVLEVHQGNIEVSNLMIGEFDKLLAAPYTGVITFSNAGGSIVNAGDTGYAGNVNSASYSVGGYALTATVDQHGVAIEDAGYGSGVGLTFGTYNTSGVTTGTLAFSNGETFDISSLGMYNYTNDIGQNFRTYVIKGYNGSALVGTVEDTALVDQTYKTFNLNFTSVTRVEITAKYNGVQSAWSLGTTSYYYVDNINVVNVGAVAGPTLTSATYDASTNVLTVTGSGMTTGDSINETMLTLTGQGGSTYTLTETGAITASSATSFSITLNSTDQAGVETLLNKNGTTSLTGNTTYNLAAATGWDVTQSAVADTTGNGVTVTNANPNAVFDYEAATGTITGFTALVGSKTVTQVNTAAGETLQADSVQDNMAGAAVSGATPATGSETLYSSANYYGETSVTFKLTDGKKFDLTSINFQEFMAQDEVVKLTSSKGSVTYTLAAGIVGPPVTALFNVSAAANAAYMQGITSFTVTALTSTNPTAFIGNDPTWFGIGFDNIALANILATGPSVTSAAYDASTNALVVTGSLMTATGGLANDIDVTKLTLTGQGGATYTLTSSNVEIDSATQFTVALNAADQLNVEGLLNKNGTSAAGGTVFNIAAAANWNVANTGNADLTGNGITVSNVQKPTITSSTYDANTGTLVVTGSNLIKQSGNTNDIDVTKLSLTGQGGSFTLTSNTTNVEITDANTFTITLGATDKASVDAKLNKNGTVSSGSTTYNLAAADDWNGPITPVSGADISDATGNAVTVSGVSPGLTAPATVDFDTVGAGWDTSIGTDLGSNSYTNNNFNFVYVDGFNTHIWGYGNAGQSGSPSLILTGGSSQIETLTITNTNAKTFKFSSFYLNNGGFDLGTWTITGKLGGTTVGTQTVTTASSGVKTLNSSLQNVDTIVISSTSGGFNGVWLDSFNFDVPVSNTAPTLGGTFTTAGTLNDNGTNTPFAGVTVADSDANNVSIAITYAAANGTLTGTGLTGSAGNYTLTSAALATVQSNLQGLVFHPTVNQVAPASTVLTTFTLTPNDGVVDGTANATTVVTTTSINDAPTLGGASAGQAVNDNSTLSPFSAFTIADPDVSASETVTITLDSAAKGAFTAASLTASGFSTADGGLTYTHTAGTPATLQAAIRALVYQPAANRVAPGSTETTTFTVSVNDSIASAVTNNTTTVVSTSINEAPTLTTVSNLTGATEDVAYTISYADLVAAGNEADVDAGTTLSFRVEAVSSGTLTKGGVAVVAGTTLLSTGESLVWTPATNANGTIGAFTVKAYDGALASSSAIAVNVVVAAANDAPTGVPTLSGTTLEGQTLTASTAGIADVDGLGSFSYQWQVSSDGSTGWSNISGANASTYALTVSEAGQYARVRVSYTDNGSTAESVNSATSIQITGLNTAPIVTTPTAITLIDTTATDSFPNQTGSISASDVDGLASYGTSGGTTGGSTDIGGTVYDVSKIGSYGTLYVKSSDGQYVFVANNSVINALSSNQSETFTVTATDSHASPATGNATLTVNITGVNDAPIITSGATVNFAENATGTAYTAAGSDVESNTISWSISGTDAALFSINSSTGALTFNSSPNYELPSDSGTNNVYNITLTAVDNGTGSPAATQSLVVTVTNVNEIPGITNLNGDTGVLAAAGSSSLLDRGTGLSISDAEFSSLNGGAGDWSGASLIIQRTTNGNTDATANDLFGFDVSGTPNFTVGTGVLLSGGQTFATFTNSGGILNISFAGSGAIPTTALVEEVMQRVNYRNDTPYGTATINFALSDGLAVTTADVNVTSNLIYVDHSDAASAPNTDIQGDAADGFTLTEALDKAANGDTIKIEDGTYYGNFIAATGGITIESVSGVAGSVVLAAPDSAQWGASTQNAMNGIARHAILDLRTSTPDTDMITVRNLTVDGQYQGGSDGADYVGIATYNTNATIDNVTISHIAETVDIVTGDYSGNGNQFGILAEADNTVTASVTIRNSTIDTFQKTGIAAWGSGLDVLIENSSITGVGVHGVSNQNGMQIGSAGNRAGTTGIIRGNTISGLDTDSTTYSATGILLRQSGEIDVDNNTISVSGNSADNNTMGVDLYEVSSTVTVRNNTFNNLSIGVDLESPGASTFDSNPTISGNNFNSTYYAVYDDINGAVNPVTITVNSNATVTNGRGFIDYILLDGNDNFTDTGSAPSQIDGGAGDDVIVAGSGADKLIGGAGNDTLTGGSGNDVFTLNTSDNLSGDRITDFSTGDRIRLDGRTLDGVTAGAGTSVAANAVQVGLYDSGTNTTLLYIDTDGNPATPAMAIALTGDFTGRIATDTGDIIVNAVPTFTSTALISATQGNAYSYTISTADTDVGDTRNISAATLPAWLTLTDNGNGTATLTGTPANGDVGNNNVSLTVTDAVGGMSTQSFVIAVGNVNDAPTLANAIADQNATEDSAFSYQFAANTFADVDAGDSLTYTTSTLPSWLSFDAATRTFSGTPANGDVGSFNVTVTATDGSNATATDTFAITVGNVNDAPTLANAIADQNATEDSAFSYQFAANTFADVDAGDSLTYTTSTLPSWLSFDAATRTFSGTPANGDVGSFNVTVTATDGSNATATETFAITVGNVNDAPTLANAIAIAIADQNTTEDSAFSYQFAANTFADVDVGDTLTYTTSTLPAWLSFDAATCTFSGTPANGDVGNFNVTVTATDGSNATVTETFAITVANTNDAPTSSVNTLTLSPVAAGDTLTYTIPNGVFINEDVGDHLTYSATLANGDPLPSWITFNTATQRFDLNPPLDAKGQYVLNVTATDSFGSTVTVHVNAQVEAFVPPPPPPPVTEVAPPPPAPVPPPPPTSEPPVIATQAPVVNDIVMPEHGVGSTGVVVLGSDATVPGVAPSLVVSNPLQDQATLSGSRFEMALPIGTFQHSDANAFVTLEAQQSNGSPLPGWLRFDSATGKFTGQPPAGFAGTLQISVIARDSQGREAVTTFKIKVGREAGQNERQNDRPNGERRDGHQRNGALPDNARQAWLDSVEGKQKLVKANGRTSFSEQMSQHGRIAADAKRQGFLDRIAKHTNSQSTV